MNIVFMGTPEFAVPCLKRLISDGHNVSGVFTQPDRPKGRGHRVQFSPVKIVAQENDIEVYQPLKMRDGEALSILKELNPELIIVVAYGQILPKEILEFPKYGCINIHASVLPRYRGAAPIQWCVLNGEKISGVTSMQMNEGLDTGDILLSRSTDISENDTAGDLHDKLSEIGAEVMSETIELLIEDKLQPIRQDDSLSNYSPMLSKDLCPVDWTKSAAEVHNQIRGLSPWPVATAEYNGKIYKLHKSALSGKTTKPAGTIIEADKKLCVACGDGNAVEILVIQAQGKKAVNSADFLRGNHIEVNEKFM